MGEVPVLEEGARRLTQSAAIMLHLAERHGAYGGANDEERQEVLRWLFFDNHKFTSYFATWRFMKSFAPSEPDPVLARWMRGRVDSAFAIVERHLSTRDHLVGEAPTIADMSLCGYLYFPAAESGYDLATSHPNMARWLQRLQALPGWKGPYELLPGDAVAPRW
jgi:glutathione S-transferase